jgi:hypothetical protein
MAYIWSLVISLHQRVGTKDYRPFSFFYRAFNHDSTGLNLASIMLGRVLRLLYGLLFGTPPGKEQPTTNHVANLVDRLHDIHNYTRRRPKLPTDQIKCRCDRLDNCTGYHQGEEVWPCHSNSN